MEDNHNTVIEILPFLNLLSNTFTCVNITCYSELQYFDMDVLNNCVL